MVVTLDYGETEKGMACSVMEYPVGQDLEVLLRAQPEQRLPWEQGCRSPRAEEIPMRSSM